MGGDRVGEEDGGRDGAEVEKRWRWRIGSGGIFAYKVELVRFVTRLYQVMTRINGKKKDVTSSRSNHVGKCNYGALYLDSLAVPNVQIPGGLQRVVAWKKPLIDKVIKLDTNIDGTFGKLKIKQEDHSIVQESLLGQMEDIERFVASKVKPSLSSQKKRMLSHTVSKVCIGITELVGNFLGEVSEIIEGDNPMDQSETTLRRSKRTKISEEDKDNVDETSLDSDYEEEEEYDDEDYESSQDNVSDEEEQDSGADEGRDVEDEELGQEGNPANDDRTR
ncbi:uncharacterized protein LOC133884088 [Phragmites australis]|uniref:uncharacterized protein LOC133884088 n=1 Tax=Phragmites australis TaxID=29695 RepID=UPI002D76D738|nr:uncharacterized protein LOC133884088 [Phragmites australis]